MTFTIKNGGNSISIPGNKFESFLEEAAGKRSSEPTFCMQLIQGL
jgi:hypothetical protein